MRGGRQRCRPPFLHTPHVIRVLRPYAGGNRVVCYLDYGRMLSCLWSYAIMPMVVCWLALPGVPYKYARYLSVLAGAWCCFLPCAGGRCLIHLCILSRRCSPACAGQGGKCSCLCRRDRLILRHAHPVCRVGIYGSRFGACGHSRSVAADDPVAAVVVLSISQGVATPSCAAACDAESGGLHQAIRGDAGHSAQGQGLGRGDDVSVICFSDSLCG